MRVNLTILDGYTLRFELTHVTWQDGNKSAVSLII